MTGPQDAAGPDAVLRALADPNRRQILRLVRGSELAAGQIAAHFGTFTQQAISQHLRVLERAGLLTERRAGNRRLYTLRPEPLDQVRALLAEFWPDALARLKDAVEHDHPPAGGTPVTSPLIATIRIAAPPATVFPYLVDPALLARWIGDATGSTVEPGGAFAVAITDAKSVQGQFLTVDPPERLVFTWGVPGSDVLPPGSTTVEIVLTADGAGTVVELTHRDLPSSEVSSHRAGWTGLLDVLARVAGRP